MDIDTTRLHLSVGHSQPNLQTEAVNSEVINVINKQHEARIFALLLDDSAHQQNCAAKPHLSDHEPIADDSVRGLGISLSPLQVVRVVVSLLDSDRVGRVKVELSVVGFCCGGKVRDKWGAINVLPTHSANS